jgi:hypothetical protein
MDEGFIFCSSINIWDVGKNERVRIGNRMCRDPSVVPTYGPYGMENCIVEAILSNSKCETLQIKGANKGFLALQISINE